MLTEIMDDLFHEAYDKNETEFGCGYWAVCDDHSCPCAPTSRVKKGYNFDVYLRMRDDMNHNSHKKHAI